MTEFIRRHSLSLSALSLLLVSLQLTSLSVSHPEFPRFGARIVSAILSPGDKLFHEIVQSGRFYWSHYLWLVEVESERSELLNRVKELESRNTRLIEFESENQRLRALLNFESETQLGGVVASVVGRDQSNWTKTITIDRGTSSGVKPGLSVVDGHAVVGQVIAASESSARVLLLTDTTSALDALVQDGRLNGIVEGGLASNLLRLSYVIKNRTVSLQVGDRVITSGMDGVFPKGVLIGVIQEVHPEGAGLFQDIQVKPSVDFERLENVLVIIPGAARKPITSSMLRESGSKSGAS